MLRRIARNVRSHDWFAVGVEVLVVVIGLLLAFQLDRWREGIVERRDERAYVDRLIADVEADLPRIRNAIALQSLRLELADLLMRVADDPAAAGPPVWFFGAIHQAAYTYTPVLTKHTFENLRATGDLRLIRSEQIKSALFDYYGYDEAQRQWLPLVLTTESRHFELAAGILSLEQQRYLQDTWLFLGPGNAAEIKADLFGADQLAATVERFRQRQDLIDWLPQIRSLQLEQIGVHGQRLEHAEAALETMRSYRAALGNSR